MPAPDEAASRALIDGYGRASGTLPHLEDTVVALLVEQAGRNPRRIKRVINSFVMEYRLGAAWRAAPLGSAPLIVAIVLQHLYPSFFDWLVEPGSGDDPIGEFLEYADVKARAGEPPGVNDAWWSIAMSLFRRFGVAPPKRSVAGSTQLHDALAALEAALPSTFPALARNQRFLALLREVGNFETRRALRSQLVSRPLRTGAIADSATAPTSSAGTP